MWILFALGRLRTGYSVAGQYGNEPGCRDPLAGLDRPTRLAPRPERIDNNVPVESGLTERWVRDQGHGRERRWRGGEIGEIARVDVPGPGNYIGGDSGIDSNGESWPGQGRGPE